MTDRRNTVVEGNTPRTTASRSTVAAFLSAQQAHDWSRVADLLAIDVVRLGPDGASCTGRDDYLRFLRDVHATIRGYELDVVRLVWSGDGRVAVAEVRERLVTPNGEPLAVTEAMVFDIDAEDRITRLSVYTKVEAPAVVANGTSDAPSVPPPE